MMDDLLKLIAAEALYQLTATEMLARRVVLSRNEFRAMSHFVRLDLDGMLAVIRLGLVPVAGPLTAPPRGGLQGRIDAAKRQGTLS